MISVWISKGMWCDIFLRLFRVSMLGSFLFVLPHGVFIDYGVHKKTFKIIL